MRPDRVIAAFLVFVAALGVATASIQAVREHQAQQAAQAKEAVQRAETAVVAREDARALNAAIAQRDQAQAQASAAEAALQERTAERDQLKDKVAALEAASLGLGSGPAPTSGVARSAGPNHFPYGWCTWWVASKRFVPWSGNAIAWLAGARAYGYPTGSTPRPGAIMVTAESGYGHVAYVESVGSGSFIVSEMNYRGWGIVDWRTVAMGSSFIRGFVYEA